MNIQKTTYTDEEKIQLVNLYFSDDMIKNELCTTYNISRGAIYYWRRKFKLITDDISKIKDNKIKVGSDTSIFDKSCKFISSSNTVKSALDSFSTSSHKFISLHDIEDDQEKTISKDINDDKAPKQAITADSGIRIILPNKIILEIANGFSSNSLKKVIGVISLC